MSVTVSGSPPVLAIPRHPSPLSFSSISASEESAQLPSRTLPLLDTRASSSRSGRSSDARSPHTAPEKAPSQMLPIEPSPDSLLLRSTFSALEHSATTLKRLSKSVLACTSTYLTLLDQLQNAEDDVLTSLGELGRWLEGGYGLHGSAVWDDESGIRKLRKEARRKEREDLEVMVEHGLKAVRSELKRNGLAGGGAQHRFEHIAKQYYQQTSDYLSPSGSSGAGPSSAPALPSSVAMVQGDSSAASRQSVSSSDVAHMTRVAQFELARYNHYSTLLYAVPPTSVPCLDLLVGLYTWVGNQLGDSLGGMDIAESDQSSTVSSLLRQEDEDTADTSRRSLGPLVSPSSSLKSSLTSSLTRLGEIRTELLQEWAARDQQTNHMETEAASRLFESSGGSIDGQDSALVSTSSHGIEHKKKGPKMHKLHRSVGGRLRDLMSSSGSRMSLSDVSADRMARMSLDMSAQGDTTPTRTQFVNGPVHEPRSAVVAPAMSSRHTVSAVHSEDDCTPTSTKPFESTPDLRMASTPLMPDVASEIDQRDGAGRKKEGVLWGAGVWEDLSKPPSKGKYEKLWVVLDRSRIYEYRDRSVNRPETAHAVIDLKFASVREGRDSDRRFVFEIVTPTQGKRMYQSTSDPEMKQWVYAICNAIESCINGTSSVRTFDTSKLRSPSGSLDDHALPSRKLFDGAGGRVGLPSIPGSPGGNRRSMPPPSRDLGWTPTSAPSALSRQRQPSFKKKMRQSAETATEKWNTYLQAPKQITTPPSRHSASSDTSHDDKLAPPSQPISAARRGSNGSRFIEPENESIEKRVLEMAGLGLGLSTSSAASSKPKRIHSDGKSKKLERPNDMTRSKSADRQAPSDDVPDMELLRRVAELPGNTRCADCGKATKSSRWATLCLRDYPMVMFLCIRCCGIHRGLGTHISKPRSVDLDIWSLDSIALARQWGNERGNELWERLKAPTIAPGDDDIADYIRAKYVEGRWLSSEDREMFGLSPVDEVGKAL